MIQIQSKQINYISMMKVFVFLEFVTFFQSVKHV